MSRKVPDTNGINSTNQTNMYYGGSTPSTPSSTSGWSSMWPSTPAAYSVSGPIPNLSQMNLPPSLNAPTQSIYGNGSNAMHQLNGYQNPSSLANNPFANCLPNSFTNSLPNSIYNTYNYPMPSQNPLNPTPPTMPSSSTSSGIYRIGGPPPSMMPLSSSSTDIYSNATASTMPSSSIYRNSAPLTMPPSSSSSGMQNVLTTVPLVSAGSLSQALGGILSSANGDQKVPKRNVPLLEDILANPKKPRGRPKKATFAATPAAPKAPKPPKPPKVLKVIKLVKRPRATPPQSIYRAPATATATSSLPFSLSDLLSYAPHLATQFPGAPSAYVPSTYIPPVNCPPVVTAKIPTPPNWLENLEDTIMSLLTYKTYNVSPTTAEYQTLAEILHPIQVTGIEQIVNPDLWDRFVKARTEMMRGKSEDLKILEKLGLNEREVMRCAHLSWNFRKDPLIVPYSDNMVLLFHCTRSSANHASILSQGLDERLSSASGGLLGKGIYFADDPNKALQYDGTGYIFVFAVLLGDCISVDSFPNKSALVREPEKIKPQRRNFNDQFFDSIVARPGGYNEYVIYNRYQCCPIYQIKYNKGAVAGSANTNFNSASTTLPPLAWITHGTNVCAMPIQDQSVSWPFFAVDIFNSMGVTPPTDDDSEETDKNLRELPREDNSTRPSASTTDDNLALLISMGYTDEKRNRELLAKFNNDMAQTVNYLLDNATAEDVIAIAPNNLSLPSNEEAIVVEDDIVIKIEKSENSNRASAISETSSNSIVTIDLMDDSECSTDETSFPVDIIASNDAERLCDLLPDEIADFSLEFETKTVQPQMEDCPICCDEHESHETSPASWEFLECKHKLCVACYSKMLTTRFTMSGVKHTFVKCPFCARSSGTEIGICPTDMQMNVSTIFNSCDGYSPAATICINYTGPHFNRTAYLPDTSDGQKVLQLLKIAFDRRLCFTIGTSNTTGRQNTIVWNIHHKTAVSGGVSSHGYPDPEYLDRVRDELKSFGIE